MQSVGTAFLRPWLVYQGGTGTHLCTLRGALGLKIETQGPWPQRELEVRGLPPPRPTPTPVTTRLGGGGRVSVDALLCPESVLMDLVYWLRLHNFPQRLLMGSVQGSMGHLLPLLGVQPTPFSPPSPGHGICLERNHT